MTALTSAVAIGDNQLLIDTPLVAGQVPGWVKVDSEMLNVGGQHFRTGTTLVLSEPAKATHNSGATVTYAGRAFDPTFVSALGAGGGAAEPGTVVADPPESAPDIVAALAGANAPDGGNPLATIADINIAEVLSNGNTVADNQQILVPDGAQFDITGLTSPSPGIGWLPDGSLTMGSGTSTIVFGADGIITISAGNGGILTLDPDGSYSLLNGSSGLAVAADGKITLAMQGIGDVLAISATGDVEVNGSGVVKLNLPTAPGAAGELWADSGIVTVA